MSDKKPLGYLAGSIMSRGDNLARQAEYDAFAERGIPVEIYSPIMNKSINDKTNMTEEENNCLAEKIVDADIERLWNSDFVVMCPEQNAIGSLCETGCLYGWKYLTDTILDMVSAWSTAGLSEKEILDNILSELTRINQKDVGYHYFDIRTNHLNEKDWRRSFSINQMLYGMILYSSAVGEMETFDDILNRLENKYKNKENVDAE